jgi:hypothetical protein
MFRAVLPIAVVLVSNFAITGCSNGRSEPTAQPSAAAPVAVRAPIPDNPCGGVRFVIDTIRALQVAGFPATGAERCSTSRTSQGRHHRRSDVRPRM